MKLFNIFTSVLIILALPANVLATAASAKTCGELLELITDEAAVGQEVFQIDLTQYQADRKTLSAFRKLLRANWPGHLKRWSLDKETANLFPLLTPEEMTAISVYTEGDPVGCYAYNKALRNQDLEELSKYEVGIKVLASGINKLPGSTGTFYRRISESRVPVDLSRYKAGSIITENSFLSSSDPSNSLSKIRDVTDLISNRSTKAILELHSAGGAKKIGLFSRWLDEVEALWAPGTQFRVISRETRQKIITPIHQDAKVRIVNFEYIVLAEIPR